MNRTRKTAICKNCGNEFTQVHKNHLFCGGKYNVGSCSYQNDQMHKLRKTPTIVYSVYKCNAKSRGLEFSISLEDLIGLWGLPCTYCGKPIETVGIDRIDNSKGYTKDNITSCCKVCNRMKLEYSTEFWISHIRQIIDNYHQI